MNASKQPKNSRNKVHLDEIEGIKVRVVDLFSLKPFDKEGVRQSIKECGGKAIVAEEHYEAGGAYEAVCGSSIGVL